ncbi:hypothetical protein QE410_001055 [Microbacterium sp. SORGH_AS 1204]|uniref:hypothetical protein n=1 Tax=Microbacterium sp. SORGH_AS_1204 TaxID=3041785 RepID=UPI002793FC1B|nr:hypothetical protein [Microbacterium sp. SORGH_AS_1204]MDQ1136256.1 hypothetical protein [Microbacterium sp. SORGH_AS_1204]
MTATVTAPLDLETVVTRLTERGIAHRRVRVGPDAHIVVSAYGARVYGPFFGSEASESWMPDAFADASGFAALHESGAWNVGGDRVWIGPEIEYMIPDRDRYWETYDLPAVLDPAEHVLSGDADEPTMHRHLRLRGHQRSRANGTEVFGSLDLGIRIRATADPLRHLPVPVAGADEVEYGGYRTELTLSQATNVPLDAEAWTLLQVRAGGTALIAGAAAQTVTDYYEPVGALLGPRPGGSAVTITGADRFKIGFAAAHVSGRMAYLRELDDDRAVLVVRCSAVWPGFAYSEEPDFLPGHRGDALHIYNDDGGLGGFAELEARGTPVAAVRCADGTDRPVTDRVLTWWFRGPSATIHDIARHLGHVEPTGGACA